MQGFPLWVLILQDNLCYFMDHWAAVHKNNPKQYA